MTISKILLVLAVVLQLPTETEDTQQCNDQVSSCNTLVDKQMRDKSWKQLDIPNSTCTRPLLNDIKDFKTCGGNKPKPLFQELCFIRKVHEGKTHTLVLLMDRNCSESVLNYSPHPDDRYKCFSYYAPTIPNTIPGPTNKLSNTVPVLPKVYLVIVTGILVVTVY